MTIPLHFKQAVSAEKLFLSHVGGRVAVTRLVGKKRMLTNKEDEK